MNDITMSQYQEIFDLKEVQSIGCLCQSCGSEFIINIPKSQYEDDECPNCGTPWTPLRDILAHFKEIYKQVNNSKLRLRLRTMPSGLEPEIKPKRQRKTDLSASE